MAAPGAPKYKTQAWLEKFGWEKGKGLGKNEQGITDFIRASKKDDNAGLGLKTTYDLKDFSHWDSLYTKAAKNVKIQSSEGEGVKMVSKTAPPPPPKQETVYSGMFVKSATVIDSSKVEKHGLDSSDSDSDSSSDSPDSNAGTMRSGVRTEEDLFAACGSRELRLFKQEGKAARLREQESSMGSLAKFGSFKAFAEATAKGMNDNDSSSSSDSEGDRQPPPAKRSKTGEASSSKKSSKTEPDSKKEKRDKKQKKPKDKKDKKEKRSKDKKEKSKKRRRDSSSSSD